MRSGRVPPDIQQEVHQVHPTYCFFFLVAASCALVTASLDEVTPIFEGPLSAILDAVSAFAFAASGSLVSLESGPHAQSATHDASTVVARAFFMMGNLWIRMRGVKCCMGVREARRKKKPCRRNFGRQGGGEKDVVNHTKWCGVMIELRCGKLLNSL